MFVCVCLCCLVFYVAGRRKKENYSHEWHIHVCIHLHLLRDHNWPRFNVQNRIISLAFAHLLSHFVPSISFKLEIIFIFLNFEFFPFSKNCFLLLTCQTQFFSSLILSTPHSYSQFVLKIIFCFAIDKEKKMSRKNKLLNYENLDNVRSPSCEYFHCAPIASSLNKSSMAWCWKRSFSHYFHNFKYFWLLKKQNFSLSIFFFDVFIFFLSPKNTINFILSKCL